MQHLVNIVDNENLQSCYSLTRAYALAANKELPTLVC